MNAMKRAHEIRREAAIRWNCTVSEIIFSECLKMAHAGLSVPQAMTVLSIRKKYESQYAGEMKQAQSSFNPEGIKAVRESIIAAAMEEITELMGLGKLWKGERVHLHQIVGTMDCGLEIDDLRKAFEQGRKNCK